MTNRDRSASIHKIELQVGDLVRVRDYDWVEQDVGIVTQVQEMQHIDTGAAYIAVTALIDGMYYTFSEKDFLLLSRA